MIFLFFPYNNRNQFPKMKRQTSGKGLVLYEQVLQKNFEIIETFLNKFPVIFKKQDNFQETIKKVTEKLFNLEHNSQKFREETNTTFSILDKKISHVKENTSRNRSTIKLSQDIIPLQQRKSSIFRISTSREQKQQTSISKQKIELLSEIDKRQQQNMAKIGQLENAIEQMQDKINFLSAMNGKNEQTTDNLIESKVDKSSFQSLSSYYDKKFDGKIQKLADQKYELGMKLIDQQFQFLAKTFRQQISISLDSVKKELFSELQKKAAVAEFRDELKEIKTIIEKMVEESIESFACKQQTKKSFMLLEKKYTNLYILLQQFLQKTMKEQQGQGFHNILQALGRQKEGIMSGFGRKRKGNDKVA